MLTTIAGIEHKIKGLDRGAAVSTSFIVDYGKYRSEIDLMGGMVLAERIRDVYPDLHVRV